MVNPGGWGNLGRQEIQGLGGGVELTFGNLVEGPGGSPFPNLLRFSIVYCYLVLSHKDWELSNS